MVFIMLLSQIGFSSNIRRCKGNVFFINLVINFYFFSVKIFQSRIFCPFYSIFEASE